MALELINNDMMLRTGSSGCLDVPPSATEPTPAMRNSGTPSDAGTGEVEGKLAAGANDPADAAENKENVPNASTASVMETVAVRMRPGSIRSSHQELSRRTSPLYSEPADALTPGIHPPWMMNQARPLPSLPPFPPPELSTFAKDGYVRCNLPAWNSASAPQSKLKVIL